MSSKDEEGTTRNGSGAAFALVLTVTLGAGFLKVAADWDVSWWLVVAPVGLWLAVGLLADGAAILAARAVVKAVREAQTRLDGALDATADRISGMDEQEMAEVAGVLISELARRNGMTDTDYARSVVAAYEVLDEMAEAAK